MVFVCSLGYDVDSVGVTGRTVTIRVRVGGGCADHQYRLFVSKQIPESFPVQTTAYLVHESNGPCRALLTHYRDSNLQPLINYYRALYGNQDDPIIIHLYRNERRQGDAYTVWYTP